MAAMNVLIISTAAAESDQCFCSVQIKQFGLYFTKQVMFAEFPLDAIKLRHVAFAEMHSHLALEILGLLDVRLV